MLGTNGRPSTNGSAPPAPESLDDRVSELLEAGEDPGDVANRLRALAAEVDGS